MASSSIPAVRTAIVDGLTALTAVGQSLQNALVYRSQMLSEGPDDFDRIVVLNAVDIDRTPYVSGGTKREDYTVPVLVQSFAQSDDLEAVEVRMWDLVAAVEAWIAQNSTLGGVPGVSSAGVDSFDDEESGATNAPDTLVAQTTLRLSVIAVATP